MGENVIFDSGMVVQARWVGLRLSVTADLLGFSHTTLSRVYTKWWQKPQVWLVWTVKKSTVTQSITLYNCGEPKSISKHTPCQALTRTGSKSRRPHHVPLLSTQSRDLRQQWVQKDWSDESQVFVQHAWTAWIHATQPCFVSTFQGGEGGVIVWGTSSCHTTSSLIPVDYHLSIVPLC